MVGGNSHVADTASFPFVGKFKRFWHFLCWLFSRYSHTNLSFGIVDLGLFPNAAERFGIYFGGSMDQLPTYILFENAAEISRIPQFDIEVKSSHPPITKRLLCRHFELDVHLLHHVNGSDALCILGSLHYSFHFDLDQL